MNKNLKIILSVLLLIFWSDVLPAKCVCPASEPVATDTAGVRIGSKSVQHVDAVSLGIFRNDICLPSTLYMLDGVQNNVFVEPLIKRWRPYNDVVRFSGTVKFQRRLERVASISSPQNGDSLRLQLINLDEFETVKAMSSVISVGRPGVGTDTVTVSIIGDSFTYGAFFKDALLKKGYVPKIRMVGLQEVDGCPGQFDEGRPGWSLQGYFRVSKGRADAYNGFWQPEGDCKYWGSTAFWQLVHEINRFPNKKWEPKEIYFTKRYFKEAYVFDQQTGLKLNPRKNDIMYDNALAHFVRYDGRKWVETKYEQYQWSFDYGKYLSMWSLKAPSILVEFLGLNDFRDFPNPATIDFNTWNKQIEQMAQSYLKVVPAGRFVVMIPQSTCGMLNNMAGDFTIKQNACMWQVRKNIIERFDRREAEHIYVVDAGIGIDNRDGYKFSSDDKYTMPYTENSEVNKIEVQWGNPHPYPNYPVMGIPLAAFIQKYR
ncbi:MAG: hypothetical protein Q8861_00550 [Bacteroidota bacterium]|nr:hypothetical protein [Bacteroidota bacterium]MDP4268501.1 hypothetical protein [Bacteroidota bacterium]